MLVRMSVASRPGERAGLGAERPQEDVILGRPSEGDPDPLREAADDDALLLEPRAEVVLAADPDEVARNRRRIEPGRDECVTDALALGQLPGEVVARVAERGCGDAGGGRGDRRRRSPRLEHRGRCGSCNRVPDPERCVAEGLRHRAQDDQVGALVEPWDDGLAAVLDVRLVDHDRRFGMAPRELDELRRRGHDARRVVRVAAPDQACAVGAIRADDGIGTREHRRDAVERVGRRDDRRRSPRREEGAGAEQDEVVGAGADDDLVPPQRRRPRARRTPPPLRGARGTSRRGRR